MNLDKYNTLEHIAYYQGMCQDEEITRVTDNVRMYFYLGYQAFSQLRMAYHGKAIDEDYISEELKQIFDKVKYGT